MARKRTPRNNRPKPTFVSFDFQQRTYQIDPDLKKVYRRFVEIETAKAVEIFSVWRGQNASA